MNARPPKQGWSAAEISGLVIALVAGVFALGILGFVGIIMLYAMSHNPPRHHGDSDAAAPFVNDDVRDAGGDR